MLSTIRFAALGATLVAAPLMLPAQTLTGRSDSVFTWHGALRAGALLTVRNLNGPIKVQPASGSEAELRAEKRPRRSGSDIRDVAFDVRTSSTGDITICSTFRGNDPCESDRGWSDDDESGRPTTVEMTVSVPRGTHLKVVTGNGAVSVERVGGEVKAITGNGRVEVSGTDGPVQVRTGNGDVSVRDATADVNVATGNGRVSVNTAQGPVDASTGNGDIDVRVTSLRADRSMGFHTGNGRVSVTLPASYNGELDASTGNGEIRSDFDLKVRGRMSPRRVRATIGEGGPTLRLTSGSGGLEVRKAQ
jgi:hypothetical protein